MSSKLETDKTSFTDLPAELRNDIYYLTANAFLRDPHAKLKHLSILRANKQIASEFTGVLYGSEVFTVKYLDPDSRRWKEVTSYYMMRAILAIQPKPIRERNGRTDEGLVEMSAVLHSMMISKGIETVECVFGLVKFNWGEHRRFEIPRELVESTEEEAKKWIELEGKQRMKSMRVYYIDS